MGKMDPYFTSDQLKEAIADFRAREEIGKVETYDKSELKKELGGEELGYNIGLSPSLTIHPLSEPMSDPSRSRLIPLSSRIQTVGSRYANSTDHNTSRS